ncbi:radical SAM protein [Albimonas pacifica]|uniref:4Fe-4S single cluster domain-containing protein n=1 Tax=Albimonas pacifica TaxID=1114924 RepID=A0A1I3GEA3_9RHOB|nr:radical SAM protein [Albimonas pacifica]SFI21744.1 4Fe-4S single cluster domain-containing protein [Albimonas pacifica]
MTSQAPLAPAGPRKFADPDVTATGEPRASVALSRPRTLWFNTGTLCNIACKACYIESSPSNDRLVYITTAEVERFLDEAADLGWPLEEVGFTGGEPFLNPEAPAMIGAALSRGHDVLVLTNAMRPMMRPAVQAALRALIAAHGARLTFRVSLDHPEPGPHDAERGAGAFASSLEGLRWLRDAGARIAVAGRLWDEEEPALRARFAALFAAERLPVDAADPAACVLFPEMDARADVPEITTACWGILGKRPEEVMCASSRMVVRRRGAARASVAACTLLPYDPAFDLGESLAEASAPVKLNHPHCAKFCVLGGASCSA